MRENVNETRRGAELDLKKLLVVYVQKWWLIALCALVAGVAYLLYTMNFVTPMYRTSVTIIVNNRSAETIVQEITGSNLSAAQKLVDTYTNIIQSDTVLTRVVENAKLEFSVDQVRSMMSTHQMGETEMFQVLVVHKNPETAVMVANAIAEEALEGIEEFVEGSSAQVVDYAQVPKTRYSPSYSKSGILGAEVGGVLALVYITLRYLLDVRLKTTEDLESIFEVPVLGQIPVFVSPEARSKGGYYAQKSAYGYESSKSDAEGGKEQNT